MIQVTASAGFGTLAILLEVSIKVRPRRSSEITLTGAMGIDQTIPLMNRWARGPLALSGAVCDGQALWVRLSAERPALEQARAAMGALDQAPEPGFWEAVREQRLPFFRNDRPLWHISLPPATLALVLPGDWLIDWGGAQRWLKTGAGAEEVRRSAAELRGYPARPAAVWPVPIHARRALLFEACVCAPVRARHQRRGGQGAEIDLGSACSRPKAAAVP